MALPPLLLAYDSCVFDNVCTQVGPTIMVHNSTDEPGFKDEIFGPVLSVLKVNTARAAPARGSRQSVTHHTDPTHAHIHRWPTLRRPSRLRTPATMATLRVFTRPWVPMPSGSPSASVLA